MSRKRNSVLAMVALALAMPAVAQKSNSVKGHVRKDGTYVAPHYRTNPDSSKLNNWSTESNVNPYTGKAGTADPYKLPDYSKPKKSF